MEFTMSPKNLVWFIPCYFVLVVIGVIFCRPFVEILDTREVRKTLKSSESNVSVQTMKEDVSATQPVMKHTEAREETVLAAHWLARKSVCKNGIWLNLTQEEAENMRVYDCLDLVTKTSCNNRIFSFQQKYDYVCMEKNLPKDEGIDFVRFNDVSIPDCKQYCDERWKCNAFTYLLEQRNCFLKQSFSCKDAVWGVKRKRERYTYCYKKLNPEVCLCVLESSCRDSLSSGKCLRGSDTATSYRIFPVNLPKKTDPDDPNISNMDRWRNYLRDTWEDEKHMRNWYAHTMERDDLNKHYHYLKAGNIEMCTIGKIATRTWRPLIKGYHHQIEKKQLPYPKGRPTIRFLLKRDPMERFLSGFLHLCYDHLGGSFIIHCYPDKYFADPGSKWRQFPKKVFLQEFIDVMPMQWNVHFMPQHTFCKKWRGTYNVTMAMNSTFNQQLLALRDMIPNEDFQALLTKKFHLNKTDPHNVPKTNHAKIKTYFTTRIIKRLIRYYARDYIELDIPLPDWIDEFDFG